MAVDVLRDKNSEIMQVMIKSGEKKLDAVLRFAMTVPADNLVGFAYEDVAYDNGVEPYFFVTIPFSGLDARNNYVYMFPAEIPYAVERGKFVESRQSLSEMIRGSRIEVSDKMLQKVKGEVLRSAIRRADFAVDYIAEGVGTHFTRRMYGSFTKISDKWVVQVRISDEYSDKFLKEQLQMVERARKDSLTQLYNKVSFEEIVSEQINLTTVDEHPAMLIIDVDHFKDVNDTFGHMEGDSILVILAEVIKSVPGGIPGRFGGDEFVLYLKKSIYDDEEKLVEVIEKIISDFKAQVSIHYPDFPMSISVGAAIIHRDGDLYCEVLENADKALYVVKAGGRDGFKICNDEIKDNRIRRNSERLGKPIDSESRIGNQLTEMAFDILEEASDVKRAVNALLQRVGVRYNLSVIVAVERNEEGDGHISYLWHKYNVKVKDEIEKILLEGRNPEDFGIISGAIIPIKTSSREVGSIYFADMLQKRVWTNEEEDSFAAIARIIGSYLNREYEYRAYAKQAEEKANIDEITGLLKVDKFKKLVDEILKTSEAGVKYAMLACDIYNFKYFNEYYGFENGDILLRDFSEKLVHNNPKVICACRDYADNFLIFVNYSKENVVKQSVQGYIESFETVENSKFGDFKVSLSVGISMGEAKIDDGSHLIDNAIAAQRVQKDTGISGVSLYSKNMGVSRLKEIAIMHMLEDALEKEQFEMFLQPKFRLDTMTLCGAEALARWRKPSGVIGMPDEFIPILEKSGKVISLDYLMYETVLRQLKKWNEEGRTPISISTNFSRHHIKNNVFLSYLNRQADQYGVDKSKVEIEITESAFVEDQSALITIMSEIKKCGFKIAIDDFGKGYSSLSMLAEIKADYVKIDKDFLNKAGEPPHPMLADVIKLINDSNMTIVCEGVETQNQVDFLREKGCQIGQGYLFGRPMSVAEFEEKFF